MGAKSEGLSTDLLAAYLNTEFRVMEPRQFTLRIGIPSSEVKAVYLALGYSSAAFLTAWNPLSQKATDQQNEAAQAALIDKLVRNKYLVWTGIGVDPTGDWPGEESVFVPGIDLDTAKSFGSEFSQNAIVWMDVDGVPQLILLQ
ncbi:DUF3293 domain-containing protein [Paracoccus methylarcula]|uniref:DUF3293 domain-containing protein n=1 Tax=Paracoccus methylarcula TaxID=72022 RepID=A0A422QVM1_9RHOB|nr:DUF3293 domain-containing protein [Paracoccus methylarcula]RNF33991.1 DUF3293 domain-containing protein [Paracoccus methylarcula]